MNMLVSSLSDINLMINEQGSRGFGVELQTRIRNLNMRDTVMDFYRNNQTGGGAYDYDSLLLNENFSVYMPDQLETIQIQMKNPNYGVVMSKDGKQFIIIDTVDKTIVDRGNSAEMGKYINEVPSGSEAVAPQQQAEPPAPASEQSATAPAETTPVPPAPPAPQPAPEPGITEPQTISSTRVKLDMLTGVSPSAQYPDGGFKIKGQGETVFEKVIRDNGEVDYVPLTPVQTGN